MKFVVKRARRGLLRRPQVYFTIVAANGKTLTTSETYNNRSDVDTAIERIKEAAYGARVVDET